ncbi:hypothetical protein ACNCQ3_001428 [Escherichia coli]
MDRTILLGWKGVLSIVDLHSQNREKIYKQLYFQKNEFPLSAPEIKA